MDKAREFLTLKTEESERVSRLSVPTHRVGLDPSYYEGFFLRGIRIDRVGPGFIACTFKVPPRLTDATGKLSSGAIANLIDDVGGAVIQADGLPAKVSLEMSISYFSRADANDELEIISRVLGHRGSYSGTSVILKNKITGELIAEGRHSLFGKLESKI
ncbi:uncharacterized protein LOC131252641 [Magnolia sinica]|uniref:uncharacterized protein LOC131252641 n=1 Tax=Magnolia sinica TaxID=86752 RepID=UPI00265A5F4B|nr:uncharacterized protein LOC131252641 [Magnolia sinica]